MTTLTQPIAKLYKRCARKLHDTCPGHFDYTSGQVYSVCSCDCHAGVSDERPAPRMKMPACCTRCGKPFTGPAKRYECQCNAVTCEDKADAVAEAVAIVTPKRKAAPKTKAPVNKWEAWARRITNKNAQLTAARIEEMERHGLTGLPHVHVSHLAPLAEDGSHHCPALDDGYCSRCGKGSFKAMQDVDPSRKKE